MVSVINAWIEQDVSPRRPDSSSEDKRTLSSKVYDLVIDTHGFPWIDECEPLRRGVETFQHGFTECCRETDVWKFIYIGKDCHTCAPLTPEEAKDLFARYVAYVHDSWEYVYHPFHSEIPFGDTVSERMYFDDVLQRRAKGVE